MSILRSSHLLSLVATTLLASSAAADTAGAKAPYIVVLADAPVASQSAVQRAAVDATIDRLAAAHGAVVEHRYHAALRGFAARLTPADAAALAADPGVALVEPDALVTVSGLQSNAPWGLDRIDQPALPLDKKYAALGDGAGVTVFVIDSGIRRTHGDFGGRATAGATAIQDGRGSEDCDGHGTHVAATVAGAQYGVAKEASIVPIRVLDCTGTGPISGIVAGIEYVIQNKAPVSVANLSLGTATVSDALDTAVRNLVAAGVTTIVAAGNSAADACTASPARVPEAITVGATTQTDARWINSNFGTCLDLFAPGDAVVSAGIASDSATQAMSGTSMAAPHVAGVAAAYLSANPGATPAQVAAALAAGATPNVVSDARSTKNLLLNARFLDAEPPQTAITSPTSGAIVPPKFVIAAEVADPNLDKVEATVDGVVIDIATAAPYYFEVEGLAPGPHAIVVTATDLAGQTSTQAITVTVSKDAPPLPPVTPQPTEPGSYETIGGCSAGGGHGAALLPIAALLLALAWRRRGTGLARRWLLSVATVGFVLVACTVGEESVIYVDSDGDGIADGVDTDGDGARDFQTPNCTTCTPGGQPICTHPIVDEDGDGTPDGLDLDCDGQIDIPFDDHTTTGTSESKCVAVVAINGTKKEISCTSTNGGPATCRCELNDELVKTCTTSSQSACSIGGGSNCCGF